jgi:hypothetical protein
MARTQAELVAASEAGERIRKADASCSLFESEQPEKCPENKHGHWRTIVCDSDVADVIECSRCGKQRTASCNFNDDFS